jgi:hypothetical protein
MIRAALNIIGLEPGETVLGPFVGKRNDGAEAQLLGVHCIGLDASPPYVLQSRVKTASNEVVDEIKAHCAELAKVKQAGITLHKAAQSSTISSTADKRVHDFFSLAELVALSDSVRRKRDVTAAFATKTKSMVQSISDYDQIRKGLGLSLDGQ